MNTWILCAALACSASFSSGTAAQSPALVYRDVNGIPHVKSHDERKAYEALGYEHARDQLLSIAFAAKRIRGQGALYLGPGPQDEAPFFGISVLNDVIVELHGLYLGDRFGWDPAQPPSHPQNVAAHQKLQALLRRTPLRPPQDPARLDQVYENLVAVASGIEKYRKHLAGTIVNVQEQEFKLWLVARGLEWVYQDPITVFDLASGGVVDLGTDYFSIATLADPTKTEAPIPDGFPTTITEEDRPPGTPEELMVPGSLDPGGSNAFCWSSASAFTGFPFVDLDLPSGGGPATGLMGDPHGGIFNSITRPLDPPDYPGTVRWFAHLVVDKPSHDEDINVFGMKGLGVGFAGFTKDVANGGSQGAGNPSDAFLLRLESDNGLPVEPLRYYDPYTDGFAPLTEVSVTIPYMHKDDFGKPSNPSDPPRILQHTVTLLRAGSFGLVVHTEPSYTPDSPYWYLDGSGRSNRLRDAPGPNLIPALVSRRSPLDPFVNAQYAESATLDETCHHFRGANNGYERLHAQSVHDIHSSSKDHGLQAGPNVCYADREGRLYSIVATTTPRRGYDDELLQNAHLHGDDPSDRPFRLEDKLYVYDKARTRTLREPVPMRFAEDLRFDWVGMRENGIPTYLTPESVGPSYMPYVLYDPTDPSNPAKNHPLPFLNPVNPDPGNSNPHYENPGFLSASNESPYLLYQKEAQLVAAPTAQNHYASPNNQLLQNLVVSGTAYSSRLFNATFEALEKNQNIDGFLWDTAAGTRPAMDSLGEVISFAWDNRNHVAKDYVGFNGLAPTGQQNYPVIIRSLVELKANIDHVLTEAARERRFFEDLWSALWDNQKLGGLKSFPQLGVSANLKKAWVLATAEPFWFPETGGVPGSIQYVTMPSGGGLIDFLWSESRIGSKSLYDGGAVLSSAERDAFEQAVEDLEAWNKTENGSVGDAEFRNSIDSYAALLAFQFRLGFEAAASGMDGNCSDLVTNPQHVEGRLWTPLVNALAYSDPHARLPCETANPPEVSIPLVAGALPVPVDAQGKVSGNYLSRVVESYASFRGYAIPVSPRHSSIMEDRDRTVVPEAGKAGPITGVPTPPYDALYVCYDPSNPNPIVKSPADFKKSDVNRLVRFFLVELGGFTLTPGSAGQPSTTSKKAAYENWLPNVTTVSPPYADYYPLTKNLVRVTVMRRLIETVDYLHHHGLTQWGDLVRARVFALDEPDQRWPASGDVACEGGSIRAVSLLEGQPPKLGFQPRMDVGGGSHHPMLVLYPATGGATHSFFNSYPGNRASASSSPYFANCMDAWVARQLLPTFFQEFSDNPSSMPLAPTTPGAPGYDPAFPSNPYESPPPFSQGSIP